jgi:hypothetical protein
MAQQTKGRERKFLRRIEDAERSGASKLDISGIRFKTIPESLSRLSNLQSLDLSGNRIAAIPESLSHLTNLQSLNLQNNQIAAIPESLSRLTNSKTLGLQNNQIAASPSPSPAEARYYRGKVRCFRPDARENGGRWGNERPAAWQPRPGARVPRP